MVGAALFPVFLSAAAAPGFAPGVHVLHQEFVLRGAENVTLRGAGVTLKAADDFEGRALVVCEDCRNVRIEGFTLDGNRAKLDRPHGLPPSNQTFAGFERHNGLLVLRGERVRMAGLSARNVAGYAVLVSGGRDIEIEGLSVSDSGGRNGQGRNNATGGVLFEDGVAGFAVRNSRFIRVLGNGVWTHSRLEAPRNADGVIRGNTFTDIGRDAIQVGHATRIEVSNNTGRRIGYPFGAVDVEGGGIPVAIDTAGNVDRSRYARNTFYELNGKCVDLDGFHHGVVEENTCVNTGGAEAYPNGHYGIVFNNNNPQMRSENVTVRLNTIQGFKYGGVFLLGSGHHIVNNRFLDLNRAGCPESHEKYGCLYFAGQPDLLSSGVYLGVSAADWSRQEPAQGNVIVDNVITGHGMAKRCVVAAPAVKPGANVAARNRCAEATRRP